MVCMFNTNLKKNSLEGTYSICADGKEIAQIKLNKEMSNKGQFVVKEAQADSYTLFAWLMQGMLSDAVKKDIHTIYVPCRDEVDASLFDRYVLEYHPAQKIRFVDEGDKPWID